MDGSLLGKVQSIYGHGFYASYAAMVKKHMPVKAKDLDQPPLLTTLVHEIPVDLSEDTSRQVLSVRTYEQTTPTKEYDHLMQTI